MHVGPCPFGGWHRALFKGSFFRLPDECPTCGMRRPPPAARLCARCPSPHGRPGQQQQSWRLLAQVSEHGLPAGTPRIQLSTIIVHFLLSAAHLTVVAASLNTTQHVAEPRLATGSVQRQRRQHNTRRRRRSRRGCRPALRRRCRCSRSCSTWWPPARPWRQLPGSRRAAAARLGLRPCQPSRCLPRVCCPFS